MWEHLKVTTGAGYGKDPTTVRYLSYLGANGWELVSAGDWGDYGFFLFFKRPHDPANTAPEKPPAGTEITHFTPTKA